jgi:hypothetical protein
MKLEFVEPQKIETHIIPGRHWGLSLSHCIACGAERDDNASKRHLCKDCKDTKELWDLAAKRFPELVDQRRTR